jgi:serine/threonine protein phosphatase PrpC
MAQDKKLVYKCGACANVSIILGKFVFTANLGNCKSFLSSVKGFEKNEVNEEHLVGNLKERQRVEAEGDEVVEVHGMMRVKAGMLNVTRCFGCFMAKGKGISAVPDIKMARIKKEMDFLIMTSDGVWEVMNKNQLIHCVWNSIDKAPGNTLTKLSSSVQDLMKQAISAGSTDNLSVIIIAFPNLNLYI